MMFLLTLLSAIAVVAASGLPATDTETLLHYPYAFFPNQTSKNNTNTAPIVIRQNPMRVGSSCPSLESEWNCLTTSFQRCASGQWSAVLDTAYGTVCEPEGFTYDFQPAFASWFPSGDTTQTIVCTETATPTSDPTGATSTGSSGAPMAGEAASGSAILAMVVGLASTALLFLTM